MIAERRRRPPLSPDDIPDDIPDKDVCMRLAAPRLAVVVAVGSALALGMLTALTPATAATTGHHQTRATVGTHYATYAPVCSATGSTNHCLAVRRRAAAKSTPGAQPYTVTSSYATGPAGGYTPGDLNTAYGITNPDAATSVTVATVLWCHDPNAESDLNTFDSQYGIEPDGSTAAETSSTFQQVDLVGSTTDCSPTTTTGDNSVDAAVEESLDVQAIRAVCHRCKILLVEANSSDDADLATALNTAVSMGATVVSNSWGASERNGAPSSALAAAFNHPGVAFLAASGDDGWFDWDAATTTSDDPDSRQAAEYPSGDPHVISVGGTTLRLTSSGTRSAETVWDSDGVESDLRSYDSSAGASGSGCSSLYGAAYWQSHTSGYSAAECSGKRLSNDISAIADPEYGFDIYDTYGVTDASQYWGTIGGTSLATPVLAGMLALAGGPQGVRYPASTLYANLLHHPSTLYDVTSGGNGYCGGEAVTACSAHTKATYDTYNPNLLGTSTTDLLGLIDCSFSAYSDTTPTTTSTSCNAAKGFDGPSGVGTPNGLGVFAVTEPTPTITPTATGPTTAALVASAGSSTPGGTGTTYVWTFGDGSTYTGTGASVHHTYSAAGTYTATVTVTDSQGLTGTGTVRVAVGYTPTVTVTVPSSVTHGTAARLTVVGSRSRNSGGHVRTTLWTWGDGTSAVRGTSPTHTWAKKGTYTMRTTLTDTSGVSATVSRTVTVR